MASSATYTPIATQTLASNTATITFSSIPQTYTDLIIAINSGGSVNLDFDMQFNGDSGSSSGTNYSGTGLGGTGSSVYPSSIANSNAIRLDQTGYMTTTVVANAIAHIMNYSNTTTYKTVLAHTNNANAGTGITVGLWRNTAAVNQIAFSNFGGGATYITGSTFTLYGIKAA